MPSSNVYVGGQLIPVPAGGANSALRDPTADGLLALFGHVIKAALDAKLAEMGGPVDSNPVTDACPAAHRFPWNHDGTFMRQHMLSGTPTVPLPGLWCWFESERRSKTFSTLWYDAYERTYKLNWIFPQVQIPDGMQARSGLSNAVSAAFKAACDKQAHPTFGYNSTAPGTPLIRALGDNVLGFWLEQGQPGKMSAIPSSSVAGNSGRAASEGNIQRFYPAYDATIVVVERVGAYEAEFPGDAMGDTSLTINHGENTADTIEILERVLPAPDDLA